MKRFLFFLCLFLRVVPVFALETGTVNVNIYEKRFNGFDENGFTFLNNNYDGSIELFKDNIEILSTDIENGFISFSELEFGEYDIDVFNNLFPFIINETCKNLEFFIDEKNINISGSFFEEMFIVEDYFAYNTIPLSNREVFLYNGENICDEDCEVVIRKDTLIDAFFLDEEGGFEYQGFLPMGAYYFVIDNYRYDFIVDSYNINLDKIDFNVSKGDFEISYIDFFSGDLIKEMEIDIYDEDNNYLFSKESVDGIINLVDIPLGNYYFIQTVTNSDYELLDGEVYFSVFEESLILKGYPKEVLILDLYY